MNAALPVYRGEIQCRMLGMAVETYTPAGARCAAGEPGELVCVKPFPCQPVGFWPLPGFGSDEEVQIARARYHQAYFAEFEGVWCEYKQATGPQCPGGSLCVVCKDVDLMCNSCFAQTMVTIS